MSKKYLSIEEAAEQLGIPSAELNRLREKGSIRAFADRGTWKFKEEDVEKLARSRQADSDPDVPLMPAKGGGSSSDLFGDEDALGDQPTIIRKGSDEGGSDSDVRLIFDDSMNVTEAKAGAPQEDSDSDVKLAGSTPVAPADDSDSDVKLAGSTPATPGDDSDSDVKLARTGMTPPTPVPLGGSDSDVKLFTDDLPTKEGSDSDVRLVSSDSSSEVKMTTGSSSVMPVVTDEEDATIVVNPAESSAIDDESGISLGEGSGIALASDSGISLERPNDSGISLSDDSSLVLTDDSGISLSSEAPSGKGSGISLGKQPPSDKKKKKDVARAAADSDDLSGTVPLMDSPLGEDDLLETQEVPSLEDSSGSGEVFGAEGDSTNVITLDDEEGYDVTSEVPRGAAGRDEEDEAAVADEEAVDGADDLVGEDDELSEDVFGAEDEDFAGEEVESGESLSELPVAPRGMVAAAEQDWGVGTHTALIISAAVMLACGTVLFDMVRNMWHTDAANHNPVASALLDMLAGK